MANNGILLCIACKAETPIVPISDDWGQALVYAVKSHQLACDYIFLPKFNEWTRKDTLAKVLKEKNNGTNTTKSY